MSASEVAKLRERMAVREDECLRFMGAAAVEYVAKCKAEDRVAILKSALEQLLARYITLVNSGDCGFWDPEQEAEVVAARAALTSATDDRAAVVSEKESP